MKKLGFAVALAALSIAPVANAATQCVGTTGASTFGSLSVTVTGCFDYGSAGPSAQTLRFGASTCNISFSAPISTASLQLNLQSVDASSQVAVNVDGSPYAIQTADILLTPLAGGIGTAAAVASGGRLTSAGPQETSAAIGLRTSAPATTTTLTVAQPVSGSDSLVQVCFDDAAVAAPTITSIAPSAGSTLGGTSVVITGTNFTGATGVSFGGTAATTFSVDSATQITVTAPARAAGVVDVVVTTAGGSNTNTAADNFTYAVPEPVPTLSEWAMILLGTILAGGAALHLQRRRHFA